MEALYPIWIVIAAFALGMILGGFIFRLRKPKRAGSIIVDVNTDGVPKFILEVTEVPLYLLPNYRWVYFDVVKRELPDSLPFE